jgi:tRNA-modifying protein YgfZ
MSVRDALHEAAGVRWGVAADGTGLPRNYGDPAAEYEAARQAAVVVDRRDRRFVRVHGRDPVKMVQGLVTNDIANAPADRAVYAVVLTAKGRMVADVRVLRDGAELLLEIDAGAAGPLTDHLRKFVPPLFARFEDASEVWQALGVYGLRANEVAGQALSVELPAGAPEDTVVPVPHPGGGAGAGAAGGASGAGGAAGEAPDVAGAADRGGFVVATSYAGVPGWDLVLPASAVDSVWQELIAAGARPAGHATLDVLRIEAGRPRWGAELGETTIPLEAGLRGRAISETKGCYTGQEVIVRILHRGHVNWLLRSLLLGDVAAPAPDAALVNDAGKVVGRITSAAWSPVHGQTAALGYVRREVEPPAQLRLGTTDGPVVTVRALAGGAGA